LVPVCTGRKELGVRGFLSSMGDAGQRHLEWSFLSAFLFYAGKYKDQATIKNKGRCIRIKQERRKWIRGQAPKRRRSERGST
jgi:hypothetical protein